MRCSFSHLELIVRHSESKCQESQSQKKKKLTTVVKCERVHMVRVCVWCVSVSVYSIIHFIIMNPSFCLKTISNVAILDIGLLDTLWNDWFGELHLFLFFYFVRFA